MNWDPLILTFKLAAVTTLLLLLVSVPLAYWLAYSRSRIKPMVETLVSMPLVLPPTVLGFYFLLAFSPGNAFGQWLQEWLGLQLVFLLGGSILIETVFNWPGSGFLLSNAIFQRDLPLLQGTILVLALFFVAMNLIVDVAQAAIDPRIKRS